MSKSALITGVKPILVFRIKQIRSSAHVMKPAR